MKNAVIIIGGGGHARVIHDALLAGGAFTAVGYVAKEENTLMSARTKYLGPDNALAELKERGLVKVVCGVGSIGNLSLRNRVLDKRDPIHSL